jgi:hypothetical protein
MSKEEARTEFKQLAKSILIGQNQSTDDPDKEKIESAY